MSRKGERIVENERLVTILKQFQKDKCLDSNSRNAMSY